MGDCQFLLPAAALRCHGNTPNNGFMGQLGERASQRSQVQCQLPGRVNIHMKTVELKAVLWMTGFFLRSWHGAVLVGKVRVVYLKANDLSKACLARAKSPQWWHSDSAALKSFCEGHRMALCFLLTGTAGWALSFTRPARHVLSHWIAPPARTFAKEHAREAQIPTTCD